MKLKKSLKRERKEAKRAMCEEQKDFTLLVRAQTNNKKISTVVNEAEMVTFLRQLREITNQETRASFTGAKRKGKEEAKRREEPEEKPPNRKER